jgi:hypothetical protein
VAIWDEDKKDYANSESESGKQFTVTGKEQKDITIAVTAPDSRFPK